MSILNIHDRVMVTEVWYIFWWPWYLFITQIILELTWAPIWHIGKRFIIILLGFLLFPSLHVPHPSSESHKGLSDTKEKWASLSFPGRKEIRRLAVYSCHHRSLSSQHHRHTVENVLSQPCWLRPQWGLCPGLSAQLLAELPSHNFLKEDHSASYSTLSSLD